MLEKIIRKEHQKIALSLYGILGIFTFILPLVMVGLGIFFQVSKVNDYGIIWIAVGAVAFLFALRKIKDFIVVYKYAISPKKFPAYEALIKDGIDPSIYDEELVDSHILESLSKKDPLLITEHFIFGYSQVAFFFLKKEDVLWAYEYNGNGLVFLDKHRIYGFTYYPTVDGNDIAIENLKHDMPYIYFGTDFDYKTVMHDQFDETVLKVNEDREEFLKNPDLYREKVEQAEKDRIEEETRKLEEEKNRQMAEMGNVEEEPKEDEVKVEYNDQVTKTAVCPKCGAEVTNIDPSCPNCGAKNDIYDKSQDKIE